MFCASSFRAIASTPGVITFPKDSLFQLGENSRKSPETKKKASDCSSKLEASPIEAFRRSKKGMLSKIVKEVAACFQLKQHRLIATAPVCQTMTCRIASPACPSFSSLSVAVARHTQTPREISLEGSATATKDARIPGERSDDEGKKKGKERDTARKDALVAVAVCR